MLAIPSAAQAGRTAINENPDGSPLFYYLSGYCDLDDSECDPSSNGVNLGYQVSLGGSDFSSKIFVTGNGLLTFGTTPDFADNSDLDNRIYYQDDTLTLADYGTNLISVGQTNYTTDQCLGFFCSSAQVFEQAGSLSARADGSIAATWFTCDAPQPGGGCPVYGVQKMILRPTDLNGETGFMVSLIGGDTSQYGDAGYVIDGTETHANSSYFFVPAQFSGNVTLAQGVPEPATWGLMILGFGAVGMSLRASRRRLKALAA